MSEVLSHEVVEDAIAEDQSNESDNSAHEEIDDTQLYNLVAANANVHVRCYWLQDRVLTLSEAMNAYHSQITRENMAMIIADVLQLLANPVMKTEEPPEKERSEEAEPAQVQEAGQKEETNQKNNTETQAPKAQEDSKTQDAENQSRQETDVADQQAQPASHAELTTNIEATSVVTAKAEVAAVFDASESKQSGQAAAKAEPANSLEKRVNVASGKNPNAPEALAATSAKSRSPAPELVDAKKIQRPKYVTPQVEAQLDKIKLSIKETQIEPRQPVLPLEIPEVAVAVEHNVEVESELDEPELFADQEAELPTLSIEVEAAIEPELTELSPLDFESAAISDDTTEPSDEKIEVAEYQPALVNLEHEMDTNSPANFDEEEILIDRLEEVDLEIDELQMFSIPTWEGATDNSDEPSLPGPMEITSPEQLVPVSLTIEEIEDLLTALAERIETSEPATIEAVNEILDKIIDVPLKLEAGSGENIITEVQAQEELEELFTELLDLVDIDSAPELIESLASLTLKWHLGGEMQKLKNEQETDKAQQVRGTHKIIKKLLAVLSTIKKAIAHACAIGKSALQLYSFNFAMN